MKIYLVAIALISTSVACEKPPPKEKTPEHAACIQQATTYVDCKIKEAAELGEMGGKPVKRAAEANRNRANISLEKCQAVLAKIDPKDACKP